MEETLSYAPELISVVHGEDEAAQESADEEQVSEEEAAEEPKEELPVVDENGVVHLTRTTTKGG